MRSPVSTIAFRTRLIFPPRFTIAKQQCAGCAPTPNNLISTRTILAPGEFRQEATSQPYWEHRANRVNSRSLSERVPKSAVRFKLCAIGLDQPISKSLRNSRQVDRE